MQVNDARDGFSDGLSISWHIGSPPCLMDTREEYSVSELTAEHWGATMFARRTRVLVDISDQLKHEVYMRGSVADVLQALFFDLCQPPREVGDVDVTVLGLLGSTGPLRAFRRSALTCTSSYSGLEASSEHCRTERTS